MPAPRSTLSELLALGTIEGPWNFRDLELTRVQVAFTRKATAEQFAKSAKSILPPQLWSIARNGRAWVARATFLMIEDAQMVRHALESAR